MKIEYEYLESSTRRYVGIAIDEEECCRHLQGAVRHNLLDSEESEHLIRALQTLTVDTGFWRNENLVADIRSLENQHVEKPVFRIGEAYAEVILEQEFGCRFYWNENRDARNPKGNKTGADLVGFIEVEERVVFLFGEVKTSSDEGTRPPQVMTTSNGMENQLYDLYRKVDKQRVLIQYLSSKSRHYPLTHPFRSDFNKSLRTYYSKERDFQTVGVLVRDVNPDERDLSSSYSRLKVQILEPIGLKLVALYLPYPKEQWLAIMNEM